MYIIVFLVLVIFVLYSFTSDYSEFLVTIKNGRITKHRGKIPRKMLNDFESALSGVNSGKVSGHKSGRGIKLSFKGDINEFTEQRLRNIVGLYYG